MPHKVWNAYWNMVAAYHKAVVSSQTAVINFLLPPEWVKEQREKELKARQEETDEMVGNSQLVYFPGPKPPLRKFDVKK